MEEREEESNAHAKEKSLTDDFVERRDSSVDLVEIFVASSGVYGVFKSESRIGFANLKKEKEN